MAWPAAWTRKYGHSSEAAVERPPGTVPHPDISDSSPAGSLGPTITQSDRRPVPDPEPGVVIGSVRSGPHHRTARPPASSTRLPRIDRDEMVRPVAPTRVG